MAKILVIGGAGFIGSHIVDLFVSEGYEVVVGDVFEAHPDFISQHAAQMDFRRSVAQPLFDADVNIDLGRLPTLTLEDGLRETVDCFRTKEKVA